MSDLQYIQQYRDYSGQSNTLSPFWSQAPVPLNHLVHLWDSQDWKPLNVYFISKYNKMVDFPCLTYYKYNIVVGTVTKVLTIGWLPQHGRWGPTWGRNRIIYEAAVSSPHLPDNRIRRGPTHCFILSSEDPLGAFPQFNGPSDFWEFISLFSLSAPQPRRGYQPLGFISVSASIGNQRP